MLDRRQHIEQLSESLGIPFTFVDAITTDDPVVPWILQRLQADDEQAERTGESLANLSQENVYGEDHDLTWYVAGFSVDRTHHALMSSECNMHYLSAICPIASQ